MMRIMVSILLICGLCADAFAHDAAVRLTNTIGQKVPSGLGLFTSLAFDTELQDTQDLHYPWDSTKITIVEPGFYLVFGNVRFKPNPNGFRESVIRLNGTEFLAADREATPSSMSTTILNPVTTRYLVPGNVVQLQVMQTSGEDLNVGVGNEYTPIFGLILIHH